MPKYRVTVVERFRGVAAEALNAFRRSWSERGAWEAAPDRDDFDGTWLTVACDIDATSPADAAEQAMRAYERDADTARLGLPVGLALDVRDAGDVGAVTRRTYGRPA